MLIKISKKLFESINDGNTERFGFDKDDFRYGTSSMSVTVDDMDRRLLKELQGVMSKSRVFGAKVCARDIQYWLDSLEEVDKTGNPSGFANMKVRKVEFFATYLKKYFEGKELHRVYVRDEDRGVTYCSYIYDIDYHPRQDSTSYGVIPEHVTLDLGWIEFGEPKSITYHFNAEDCSHYRLVKDSLKLKHIYFSNNAFDKQYEESVEKFNRISGRVGEQYLATGAGTDDVDSEGKSSRSYWWRNNSIILDKDGEPANAVIDIFKESDEESNRSRNSDRIERSWWWGYSGKDGIEEDMLEELPIHPNLVIFALRKQQRLRVHVDQLVKYKYDKRMGSKLILPDESNSLIKTLVSYKGGFQDIIKNKGGGAVVLCAGIPGTGKTLTAEVYAEVMEKPLYTVQCSQLGIEPDDLEKELLTIFSRSERWNAILLLDEADVYIRERGDDLRQNAIVGVFLRVLEYYHGVLFMTTNRPEIVDDAVASRCIAKIEYLAPSPADAKRIWKVLSEVQGIDASESVINALVKKYSGLTGRDIKNLLKLAKLTQNGNKKLDIETIDFVKKFKPTR